MAASQIVLHTWTEVYHQIFGGWDMQNMWYLPNVWCVKYVLVEKCLQIGKT